MGGLVSREVRGMVGLALPLVLAELGWMMMGVVDTIMVGHLPHPAITISAAALGQVLYNTLAFGVGGVLLGLDTYISQAHGAGDWEDANRWLLSGVALTAMLGAVLMGMAWLCPRAMVRLPVDHEVMRQAVAFLDALNWGSLPLFLYMTLRRYLQAFNHVRPIAAAVVSANAVNAGLDWLLLFGHRWSVVGHSIGIAAYGVVGAAVSTALARLYLAAFVAVAVWWLDRRHSYGLRRAEGWLDAARIWRLVRLGAPVGGQIFVEISIFAAVTAMIGLMGPVPLAGHEIAFNCVATTFMVPFAISAAGTVRVGQAVGRVSAGTGTLGEAAAAGWTAIGLGSGFMLAMSALLVAMPARIAGGFTRDPIVIAATVPLLLVGAAFQFFDGVQVTATGALRGLGDTQAGLVVQLIGYWVVGLPLGIWLGFGRKMGAVGLWIGLCAGLMIAGVSLVTLWGRAARRGIVRA